MTCAAILILITLVGVYIGRRAVQAFISENRRRQVHIAEFNRAPNPDWPEQWWW
jgi:hypothetical protein